MGWIFSKKCRSRARLDGKTVIVTGCNTGIGKETVREFYKRGGKVIMACRSVQKAEAAAQDIKKSAQGLRNLGEIVIKELDLSSFESVRSCATNILKTEACIHLLVNNAGVMAWKKELSKDGYELDFATNHLGHFLFTLLLLPKIIQSAPARIVIVTSKSHLFGGKMRLEEIDLNKKYQPFYAYCRSKLANVLFAIKLSNKLKGTGVNVYTIHPGLVVTEVLRYFEERHPMLGFFAHIFVPLAKTSVQGAQTTLYCSLDEKCANETGLYYEECAVATPHFPYNPEEEAKELWDDSIELVKLQDYDPFFAVDS